MARPKLRPPTSRRRPGRGGRRVNMGWWTTVSAIIVFGILGVVMSRGASTRGDIVFTLDAPEIGDAQKISVSKVMVEPFDRVDEGDAILEVKAGKTTRKIEAPVDGVVGAIGVTEGQEVAPGDDLVRVQTGPDFKSADHWHTAYGVNICGTWLPPIGQFESDFHTHGDGLLHAHPRSTSAAGRNATLRLFFERAGLEVTATKLEYSDGKTYRSGDVECGEGDDKKEAVLRWALNGKEQKGNPANYVAGNGDVLAIAFVPEDDELPTLPPSTSHMVENYVAAKHPDAPQREAAPPTGQPPTGQPPDATTPTTPAAPAATTPTTAAGG